MNAPAPVVKLRALTCARCGTAFDCGSAAGHCWCFDENYRLPLPPEGSAEDCLCPQCLKALAVSMRQKEAS